MNDILTYKLKFPHDGHPLRKLMDSDLSIFDDFLGGFNSFIDNSFPPYNSIITGENEYKFEIALAGFSKDDIEITLINDHLNIQYNPKKTKDSKDSKDSNDPFHIPEYPRYLHKGISEKSFNLKFKLPKNSEVSNPTFNNGLLTINVKKIVLEKEKIKTLKIE